MKKFIFLFLITFILSGFSLVAQTSTLPENGDGSKSSPYEIATLDNLYWLSQTSTAWNNHFVQTADIDAFDTQNWDNGAGFTPIGFLNWDNLEFAFTGSYDGQEHTISNLTINRPGEENLGLFGFLYSSGTIKNIGLVDVDIIGKGAGALVGTVYDRDVRISNCYSTGNITSRGGYTGGLVAWFAYGKMDCCYSKVTVEGTVYAGGLVGYCLGGKIYNSYSCGDISAWSDYFGLTSIGGLIGDLNNGATVDNCFSTGHVGEAGEQGGLISSISDSNSKVTNCFWDTETSGMTSSAGGIGKTTEEMQSLATYFNTNWDFPGTWHIDETKINPDNNGYPSLTWQGLANVNGPIVQTQLPTEILSTTATLNGTIAYQGASTASQHGFVWNTTGLPVVEDNPNKTEEGAVFATGTFSSSVIGLSSGETYYVRAYATNDLGTVYGDEISFMSKRVVTITGSFTVDNKDYDRTTIATLKDNNLILNGLSLDDQVSLTNIVVEFASADPLPDQTVSITSAELSGLDASKYALSLDGAPTTTGSIQLVDYQLTINAIPLDGGTVSDEGRYLKSDVIHLTASPVLGYEFVNWTGDVEHLDDASSASPILTMPNVDVYLTANFELIDYQLSLNFHPVASGTASGYGAYNRGAIVEVSATPAAGYQFVNWTDAEAIEISSKSAFNYTMPADNVTLTANFELIDYQLSFNISPETGGIVSGGGTKQMGDIVTISATPATGYQFVNWTDAEANEISNQTPFDYTMPASNKILTANFELIDYQLSINFHPVASGTASGYGAYNRGAIVEVSATPATGYKFVNWTDDDENTISNEANFNYTMPADDVVLIANFAITIPFFEGFENCSDQQPVDSWGQASVNGYSSWMANSTYTDYNRTPHTGDFNAYLEYSNSQWLFTPTFIELKASEKYEVSLYARQDRGNASDATITLKYGTTASPEGMTGVIKNPTGVVNGDYQLIEGLFSPNVDGFYYIGILGTTNYEPEFVSIDDISIVEVPASDAALTKILNPEGVVELNSKSDFTVLLKNKGLNNLTEVNIDWYINNDLEAIDIQTFSWTGNLATDEEEEVVLTKTTLSTPGENSFSASINWAEDMRVENNTLEKSVYVATQACGYTVHLVDAWGDGWDGIIGFKQNGELIGTFGEGFTSGKTFGPVTIDLWDGLETQIVVVHPEEYSEEVGFTVLDRLDEVVYHRDPGEEFDADFVFHTFIATCELPDNDARAVSIDVPTFIGLGIPTNIQGTVQNLSSSEKTFEATLFIFDETDVQKFETTVEVTFSSLESGTIDFGEWTPIEEGSYSLELSVILASDENSENNTLEKLVYVATQACGYTVHLVDDYGDGWDGTIGFMQNGLLAGTFGEGFHRGSTFGPVTIDLWEGLETEIVVVKHETYSDEVGFTVFDRLGEEIYHRESGEEFDSDFVFHTFTPTCTLPDNDVRAVSIDVSNFMELGLPTSIQGTVQNFSNSEKTFEATLSVFDETSVEKFTATIEVTLSSVESKTINFGEWTTIEEGSYYAELTVFLIDDEEPDNDSVSKDFFAVNRLLWGDNGYLEGSSNDIPSVNLGGIDNGLIETADDFILPVGSWHISSIMVDGEKIKGVLSGYLVRIYADAEGVPGEIIHEEIVETTEGFFIELNFSEPIVLEGGHYWLMVAGHFPDASSIGEGLWVWNTWNKIIENKFMIRDNPNISGIGTSSWIDPQFLGIQEGSTIFWVVGEEMRVNLDVVADPVGMGWVNGEESLFMEVQAGTQTTLTATPATGYQFISWTDADGNTISTEAAFDYTLPTNDVVLTANFGVITSLNNRKETELLILPNPFDIEIIIKGGTNIKQINIANVLGKIIFKIGHPVSNIQTSHFSPGVYILTIEENNGQVSKYKLVKK